jgi:hypothetical protein
MQIHQIMTKPGTDIWYTDGFRNVLESHLTFFRSSPKLRLVAIDKHMSYKYEGDLYGLMDELGINKQYHFLVMILNGYSHPADYDGNRYELYLPDTSEVDMVKNVHRSKKSKL